MTKTAPFRAFLAWHEACMIYLDDNSRVLSGCIASEIIFRYAGCHFMIANGHAEQAGSIGGIAMRKKLLLLLFLLSILGMERRANADCLKWVEAGKADNLDNFGMIAYDENEQKVAYCDGASLWYFNGSTWELYWQGVPNAGPGWNYILPDAFYFDEVLQTLVLIGSIHDDQPGDGEGGLIGFRYTPGQGFLAYGDFLEGSGVLNDQYPIRTMAYDSARKRAVFAPAISQWEPVTIEYDGIHFYVIPNADGLLIVSGFAAYDPESAKTVFAGTIKIPSGWINKTCIYDGTSWTRVDDQVMCADSLCPTSGIAFDPSLHGIVSLSNAPFPQSTWLFNDGSWQTLTVDTNMGSSAYGWLVFDYNRNKMVLLGEEVGTYYMETWEFGYFDHCRPTSRP